MNMHSNYSYRALSRMPTRQSGVVLIVALIMLLVMTITGVTTMSGSTLQERMASNQRQRVIAINNADQGLRQAEAVLNGLHGANAFSEPALQAAFAVGAGLYTEVPIDSEVINPLGFPRLDDTQWLLAANAANSAPVNDAGGNTIGRYIIQYMGAGGANAIDSLDYGGPTDYAGESEIPGGSGRYRHSFRITVLGISGDANNNITTIIESYYLEQAQP
jgi:type IV pilus assembly protein PilX